MLRFLTYLSTKTMCIAYAIAQINVKISIQGNLDDKSKLIIERSAKNCPVHHTLGSDTIIDLSFNYS